MKTIYIHSLIVLISHDCVNILQVLAMFRQNMFLISTRSILLLSILLCCCGEAPEQRKVKAYLFLIAGHILFLHSRSITVLQRVLFAQPLYILLGTIIYTLYILVSTHTRMHAHTHTLTSTMKKNHHIIPVMMMMMPQLPSTPPRPSPTKQAETYCSLYIHVHGTIFIVIFFYLQPASEFAKS